MTITSELRNFVEILKEWPAPTTLVMLVALVAWVAYADVSRHAKAGEVQQLKQDVSELRDQVKDGRVETLEGQMFEAKVTQCKSSGDLRQIYAERVANLQARYAKLTGKYYSLPECSEL